MAIEMTRHEVGVRDALGPQEDDAISVANGSVEQGVTGGFYRIRATSDCTVRIGNSLSNAANGETWKADEVENRYIPDGVDVAVDAPA